MGCPHLCSFCNQHSISGSDAAPSISQVKLILDNALKTLGERVSEAQIAFFGGSFTAIPRKYMEQLLNAAQPYIGECGFNGIRISTRPDCIDEEILSLLKKNNVVAIELGIQSMDDDVLLLNDRGHDSSDVINAAELIKSYGFELGAQMMVGLYADNEQTIRHTASEIVRLEFDTVRIYPVAVLKGTKLAELYNKGEFVPPTIDSAIDICADLIMYFTNENIDIIRVGLHASEVVEQDFIAGIYHPAFRELCENKIYYRLIKHEIGGKVGEFTVHVASREISKAIGQNKSNVRKFMQQNINLKIKPNDSLEKYQVVILKEV
mgnify:CR=1 FL=1